MRVLLLNEPLTSLCVAFFPTLSCISRVQSAWGLLPPTAATASNTIACMTSGGFQGGFLNRMAGNGSKKKKCLSCEIVGGPPPHTVCHSCQVRLSADQCNSRFYIHPMREPWRRPPCLKPARTICSRGLLVVAEAVTYCLPLSPG